jgi:hypothetical protein
MRFYELALGTLALWRLCHLLIVEDGPWGAMLRLRNLIHGEFWNGLFGCFYCLSLWLAAPLSMVLGDTWLERGLLWPALSAGAVLLQGLQAATGPAPAHFVEDEEKTNGMLQ